jgi:hypothetical protein
MTQARWLLACMCLVSACSLEPKPATQVMVVVNSDLSVGDELKRVRVEVLDPEGSAVPVAAREFALRADMAKEGTHTLPLSFSVVPGSAQNRFLLAVFGYASHARDAAPIVEQKVVAAFQKERTLLLEVFLGRVCVGQLCGEQATCYVTPEGEIAAGECGQIPERELRPVAPEDAFDAAMWPASAERDAGGPESDGSVDAEPPEMKTDADVPEANEDGGAPQANPPQQCEAITVPSEDLCAMADTFEPNDDTANAHEIVLSDGCTVLESTLRGAERDVFTLVPPRNDPMLVRLGYTAVGQADLALARRREGGTTWSDTTRSGPSEVEQIVHLARRDGLNEFRVHGSNVTSCQPYALSIDMDFCTDVFEDNDTMAEAKALSLDKNEKVTLRATSHRDDEDYYQFVTLRADPVRISGSYEVEPIQQADLDLLVYSATGSVAGHNLQDRAGTRENWSLWLYPKAPNTLYRINVRSSAQPLECVSYTLNVDGRACTDEREDDDSKAAAKPIAARQTYAGTVIQGDDDFFDLSGFPLGTTCVVRYSVPTPAARGLSAWGYSQTGDGTGDDRTEVLANGERVLTYSFSSKAPGGLRLDAAGEHLCYAYTIRCE